MWCSKKSTTLLRPQGWGWLVDIGGCGWGLHWLCISRCELLVQELVDVDGAKGLVLTVLCISRRSELVQEPVYTCRQLLKVEQVAARTLLLLLVPIFGRTHTNDRSPSFNLLLPPLS